VKESLRQLCLGKLSKLSEDELLRISFSLSTRLTHLFEKLPKLTSQIGAAYLPYKKEIAPAYQELLHQVPLNLSYPILKDGQMGFALPEGLPKGTAWLKEPFKEVEPQWFLIPGLGFDMKGGRLGRGKGFYDRYLENRSGLKIGVTWTDLIFDNIPVESHDSRMDFIITEDFCWDVSAQKRI
jgi:5-formyltetrahydrofolate cyclo-ligase